MFLEYRTEVFTYHSLLSGETGIESLILISLKLEGKDRCKAKKWQHEYLISCCLYVFMKPGIPVTNKAGHF